MDKKSKDNRKTSYILIVISIILILTVGIGGWFLGTKFATRDDDLAKNTNTNTNVVPEKVEKEDDSKDYVYDATYTYENKFTEYKEYANAVDAVKTLNHGIEVEYTEGTQYLENLKVPYINIKSETAEKVNEQIETLYLEYAKSFEDYAVAVNESASLPIASHILTYRSFIAKDILSIVIIYDKEATSNWNLKYLTYNFDLKTGSMLSYEGVLSRLGYDKETTLENIKKLISDKINSLWIEYQIKLPETEKEKFILEASERLESSISSKEILFFVNDNLLNVIEKIEYGDESSNSYIFSIHK